MNSKQILAQLEAAVEGRQVWAINHGVAVSWDGDFEYYLNPNGDGPMTREQALQLIAFRMGELDTNLQAALYPADAAAPLGVDVLGDEHPSPFHRPQTAADVADFVSASILRRHGLLS